MEKKYIQNICAGLTALAITSGAVVGTKKLVEKEEKKESYYLRTATVIYNDDKYDLNSLYLLSKDDEVRLCVLKPQVHNEYGYHFSGEGLRFEANNTQVVNSYIDIDTEEEIAIHGYEELFGYTVESALTYFPFGEYGQGGRVIIDENEFKEGINNSSKKLSLK